MEKIQGSAGGKEGSGARILKPSIQVHCENTDMELLELRDNISKNLVRVVELMALTPLEKAELKAIQTKLKKLSLETVQNHFGDLVQFLTVYLVAYSEYDFIKRQQSNHEEGERFRSGDLAKIRDAVHTATFERLGEIVQKTRSDKPRAEMISLTPH